MHGEERHRRHLGRGRGRLTLSPGDPEPPGRPALAQNADHGALVAVGGPHPQRVRDGEPDRRGGARRGRRPARLPAQAAGQASAPPPACRTWRRRRRVGTPRLPAGRARGIAVHESFGSSVPGDGVSADRGRHPGAPGHLRHRLRHRGESADRSRRRWSRGSPSGWARCCTAPCTSRRAGCRSPTSTTTRSCGWTRCRRSRCTSCPARRNPAGSASRAAAHRPRGGQRGLRAHRPAAPGVAARPAEGVKWPP